MIPFITLITILFYILMISHLRKQDKMFKDLASMSKSKAVTVRFVLVCLYLLVSSVICNIIYAHIVQVELYIEQMLISEVILAVFPSVINPMLFTITTSQFVERFFSKE